MEPKVPEDIGLKVATKAAEPWYNIVDQANQTIDNLKRQLIINGWIKDGATKMAKELDD